MRARLAGVTKSHGAQVVLETRHSRWGRAHASGSSGRTASASRRCCGCSLARRHPTVAWWPSILRP